MWIVTRIVEWWAGVVSKDVEARRQENKFYLTDIDIRKLKSSNVGTHKYAPAYVKQCPVKATGQPGLWCQVKLHDPAPPPRNRWWITWNGRQWVAVYPTIGPPYVPHLCQMCGVGDTIKDAMLDAVVRSSSSDISAAILYAMSPPVPPNNV